MKGSWSFLQLQALTLLESWSCWWCEIFFLHYKDLAFGALCMFSPFLLFAFLPKGEKEDDKELSKDGIYRSALDLRPLTLTNADSKMAAGMAHCISCGQPRITHPGMSGGHLPIVGLSVAPGIIFGDRRAKARVCEFGSGFEDTWIYLLSPLFCKTHKFAYPFSSV